VRSATCLLEDRSDSGPTGCNLGTADGKTQVHALDPAAVGDLQEGVFTGGVSSIVLLRQSLVNGPAPEVLRGATVLSEITFSLFTEGSIRQGIAEMSYSASVLGTNAGSGRVQLLVADQPSPSCNTPDFPCSQTVYFPIELGAEFVVFMQALAPVRTHTTTTPLFNGDVSAIGNLTLRVFEINAAGGLGQPVALVETVPEPSSLRIASVGLLAVIGLAIHRRGSAKGRSPGSMSLPATYTTKTPSTLAGPPGC